MNTPTTGEIRPNSAPSLADNESPNERGPSLKLVVSNVQPTAAQPLTMDDVMGLIATSGKRHAFAAATAAIHQGDEIFIHEVIALAVTWREVFANMMALHGEKTEREAQIVRLVPGGQREDKER